MRKNWEMRVLNIFTSIEFLNANPIEKSLFKLKPKNMANLNSSKTHLITESAKKLISKKEDILEYFNDINKTLNFEYKKVVEEIINGYLFLLEKINDKIVEFEKRKTEEMIGRTNTKFVKCSNT